MSTKAFLLCAASIAMLGASSGGAIAAPLGAQAASTPAVSETTTTVEKAYYGRRCWRHRGAWVCRRYGYRAPLYGYNAWGWGGPSLGLYFGGGGRGWRGGHHFRGGGWRGHHR